MAALHPSPPFDELTYYPISRWIRGMRGGDTIVDSRRAVLVWEPGRPTPIYAFPPEDVSIVSDDESAEGLREFADPVIEGYVTIAWDALDHWYEEDEEVFIHPRDPFVRVDALKSSRHVRVERDGHLLAESDAPVLVFETGRPTRYYLKPSDLDESLLEDSELQTGCPYKGYASYHDVVVAGWRHPNLFWYYRRPFAELSAIKDLIAPYSERVDVIVDGELQERPAGPLGRRGAGAKRAA
jgi:uncharacterized protein (DUF427 family)